MAHEDWRLETEGYKGCKTHFNKYWNEIFKWLAEKSTQLTDNERYQNANFPVIKGANTDKAREINREVFGEHILAP